MWYTPTDEELGILEDLMQRDDLTKWEAEFLSAIMQREQWSPKMHAKFNEIFEAKQAKDEAKAGFGS